MIYLSELLLAIPIAVVAKDFKLDQIDKRLWLVTLSFVLAFFIGMDRGDSLVPFNPYWGGTQYKDFTDRFNWSRDSIRLARWLLLFSTPALFAQFMKTSKISESDVLKVIYWCSLVSGLLAIAEAFSLVHLENWGYYESYFNPNWSRRSYGTFSSPVDAALVYFVLILISATKIKTLWPGILVGSVCVFLTQGTTALIFGLVSLAFLFKPNYFEIKKLIVFLFLFSGSAVFTIWFFSDLQWASIKMGGLYDRLSIWKNLIFAISSNPESLFLGKGFSSFVTDSSYLSLLLMGGLLLFISGFSYISCLCVGLSLKMGPIILLWVLSWVSLDSMGYWGMGRLGWLLLGLNLFERNKNVR